MSVAATGSVPVFAIIDLPAEGEAGAWRAVQSLAEASQAETGCVSYTVHRSVREPRRLIIQEEWRDAAALEAHRDSLHVTDFRRIAAASGIAVWASSFEVAT